MCDHKLLLFTKKHAEETFHGKYDIDGFNEPELFSGLSVEII